MNAYNTEGQRVADICLFTTARGYHVEAINGVLMVYHHKFLRFELEYGEASIGDLNIEHTITPLGTQTVLWSHDGEGFTGVIQGPGTQEELLSTLHYHMPTQK